MPDRISPAPRSLLPLFAGAVMVLLMAIGVAHQARPSGEEARLHKLPAGNSGYGRLPARIYNSGFDLAHDSYNGISSASDGKIYYVLSSETIDTGAQVYRFDPATEKILGDDEAARLARPAYRDPWKFPEEYLA